MNVIIANEQKIKDQLGVLESLAENIKGTILYVAFYVANEWFIKGIALVGLFLTIKCIKSMQRNIPKPIKEVAKDQVILNE